MAYNQSPQRRRKVSTIYVLPNLLTTTNMFFGFMAIIYAIRGEYLFGSYAIVAAAVFDLLDGRVARMTDTTSHFGAEYDSLCDLVSFGMAPALIMYLWALQPFGRVGWLASFVFVACGALRLARFNVQSADEKSHFQGLPIPMAAGIVASSVLCFTDLGVDAGRNWLLLFMTFLLGLTMVSNFRYRSFKDLDFKQKQPFTYLVIGVLILILVATRPELMLFVLFFSYAILGAILGVFHKTKAKTEREKGTKGEKMSRELSVGIVGATGLVGETFLKLLGDSKYKFKELRPFASEKSEGLEIAFRDTSYTCQVLKENCFEGLDVVFFSSGDPISKEWAPKAAAQGAIAIDNSAAYRMDPEAPLVVPEINFDEIKDPLKPRVIANPNCSTIQLVMVLHALKKFQIKDVRVASYQSVSGAGKEGITDLINQTRNTLNDEAPGVGNTFNPPIAFECQPKIGSYNDAGFCSEEVKIMNETKKILSLPELNISAFTVRVPTLNGHGEAAWVTFANDVSTEEIENSLTDCPYIRYLKPTDEKSFHSYKEVSGESDAFVSRLRKDVGFPNTWMMWIVADNLYRGAASNGLLIAQRIFDKLN